MLARSSNGSASLAVIACAFLVLASAVAARAAEVVVKGEDLEGKVVGVTSGGVAFETIYGSGAIQIPWADVERLQTEERFLILHGDTGEARGRLLGVSDGQLQVGDDAASAESIDVASIHSGSSESVLADSYWESLRARYRFWRGDLGLTAGLTRATTDTSSFASDFEVERRKQPTRLLANASYRFSATKEKGFSSERNENGVRGLLRGEYDLSERFYTYTAVTGEYDEIQSLSFRTAPKAGVGYRIVKTERAMLSADIGGSYVYERYFGGDTNDYFAAAFGGECSYELPKKMTFSCRGEYLPAVDDWTRKYLLRGTALLSIPMLDWLSFRFKAEDEYNSQPAPDTDHNRMSLTAGLAVGF